MKEEIKAAVDWWTDILASNKPDHDNGDGNEEGRLLLEMLSSLLPKLDEHKIEIFRAELTKLLVERISKYWDLDNPDYGSYFRVIYNDYGPDRSLREAAKAAGIDRMDSRFPIKTSMRIDPGKVSVSRGYRSPYVILYEAADSNN